MKRLLTLMMAALFLTACGEDEVNNAEVVEPLEEVQEEVATVDISSDPMEVGNKNSDMNVLEFNHSVYEVTDWYANADTDEDGFNTVDFEGYNVKYAMAVVMDDQGEESIGFFVETENTTDVPIQYNGDLEIITDTQDQTQNTDGVGYSKPGVKLKGFSVAPLEYGVPESFTVTLEAPYLAVDQYLPEAGHFGDDIEVEFVKE